MILVTGATGHLGRLTIDFLLKKVPASDIAALVRDTAKGEDLKNKGVELRQGDYTDNNSLVSAFKGIDKLLLISSNDLNDRSGQHLNAINAAKEAGVKHIFYTSISRKNKDESQEFLIKSHIDTENYLKTAGITYTVLQNNFYTETIPMVTGEKVLETGIFFPGGNGKIAYASRQDMAEATANILTSDGHENKIYNFSGNKSFLLADLAELISGFSGKKVNYTDADPVVFKQALSQAGVPEVYVDLSLSIGNIFKADELDTPDPTLENFLGRKPATVEDFLKQVYSKQLV
jgi:NAD(P)H dehydrogenase (quinone)